MTDVGDDGRGVVTLTPLHWFAAYRRVRPLLTKEGRSEFFAGISV